MGKYAQIVVGPAGSGKTTYCQTVAEHYATRGRSVHVANLDPAAENFSYKPAIDVRDLVSLPDVMKTLNLGPNGGLIYCMEYFLDNIEWLSDALGDFDGDYILFDCPGQIELYTHIPIMKRLISKLVLGFGYNVCVVFILDAHFVNLPAKFVSGSMYCLSAMVQMEAPQINILSKVDLMKKDPEEYKRLKSFLKSDMEVILPALDSDTGPHMSKLNQAIAGLINDYSLVCFLPMDISDYESVEMIAAQADNCVQFGEDEDVKVKDFGPDNGE